ncbi:GerW family sporulation protein [Acetonema longum]|uniref:Sporulation protein YtfJ n=1 Tax=Acetonema longum DSM 6540 TaxID=1009370 RepID=F7NK15_9FIRM|nr:GerW family sporulation protein [Acetonema longum]EGO63662.1 sporulation protein YtfJ [Acetonema longum DSM 6540]
MADHPIENLMKTTMESIKEMVDVNTIVGDAVETPDGTVIIPISRVTFGFAAGGGDCRPQEESADHHELYPFGGGSGAGVSVRPVGFLVCSPVSGIRFMSVENNVIYERMLDLVPQVMNRIEDMFSRHDPVEDLARTAQEVN